VVAKTFEVEFDGFWIEERVESLEKGSGIYTVHTCVYNAATNTVDLRRLIYIGEAENVNERLVNHEKWPTWRRHRQTGEILCFAYGKWSDQERKRIEAALIYEHKPPANEEYKDSFPFDETTVYSKGTKGLLKDSLTARRTSR